MNFFLPNQPWSYAMKTEVFLIRRSFLLPLGLLILAMVALFILCLIQGEDRARIAILGLMILPAVFLFVESFLRRIEISDVELTTFRFMRRKTLRFADLTEVVSIRVRGRAFVTLCAGDDFLVFTNAYDRFPQLLTTLLSLSPPQIVSVETRTLAASAPVKISDIVSCWLGLALILFFFAMQLHQHP